MVFKVTFADGSVETIYASNAGQAKLNAITQFRGRVVAKVAAAGLVDMANRRPQAATKTPSQGN